MIMKIVFYTAGGTIDKIYFDAKSKYEVGESILEEILREGNATFDYENKVIMQKDSLDLTDADRDLIFDVINREPNRYIILTHGTDTMVTTAKKLNTIKNKVIVLTGSMSPARFRSSDAGFNIACAITAVQTLNDGVYIAMNGRIFRPDNVRKNVEKGIFEETM
jgi:L-asparaginase